MKLKGILAAMVTPMNGDESINVKQLGKVTDHLIRKGVHGLVPLGSTGEFYALTPQERHMVLQTVLETTDGRVPVVAGANGGSTREVIENCRAAERLGCQGVMLAPPYYSLPRLDELFAHFQAIDSAIGIPITLYNYPGRTGVDMTPDFIERLAELKNVQYVKESTGEMPRITTLIRKCGGRLGVFCGCDTIALESFLVGAIGWIGGVANVLPKSHAQLYNLAVEKKDFAAAKKLFYQMLPTLELMEGGGKYTQWVKAACGLMGLECGAPRRPLGAATKEECAGLSAALRLCAEGKSQ